ncbi:MAG: nucleoside triphosphate pyrophosphohydrolase [Terrimicrobiaceae bacterium]|nr:nucleoside triphosphate pyrophosphohydrolase [Terrimicrobiaceae bacterium]
MSDISRLVEIVARLRAPGGCPWDREQTHESLKGALVEECYEAVEAISRADDRNLREELGDLLLHVVMHSCMAGERQAFTLEEVIEGVCEKLVRRHPHVFADGCASDSGEVLRQWERIKREEKGPQASIMDGLPAALPALLRAQNAQKKAARAGFDWRETAGVLDKIEEECRELREALAAGDASSAAGEIGDLLFSVANLARHAGVDAELALAASTTKFVRRFQAMEAALASRGRKVEECGLEELDEIWEEVKAREGLPQNSG